MARKQLMVATGVASVVFTIGTAIHAFVIVNEQTLHRMMELAGADPAGAPGFLTTFRIIGSLYIVGNAIGVLALARKATRWLFWTVLAVNVTQAAGVRMVPPEMWTATREHFGVAGMLPSLVTDGGALILAVTLVIASARARQVWGRPWECRRPARSGTRRARGEERQMARTDCACGPFWP